MESATQNYGNSFKHSPCFHKTIITINLKFLKSRSCFRNLNKKIIIMNSSKSLIMALVVALIPAIASAFDFKEGGLCYNINPDGKTVSMTYENLILFAYDAPAPTEKGYLGSIVIPEKVSHKGTTFKVVAIDRETFMGNMELQQVIIPRTVTEIGVGAFTHCNRLEQIVLPDRLKKIDEYTFAESGLRSITIPRKVKTIGQSAFNNCSLKSVVIPGSVKKIEKSAFSACRWLESLEFENGLQSIGEAAFSICTSLKALNLPESLKEIGDNAFYECSSVESVTIPASVTSIGDGAFSSCHALKSIKVAKGNKKYDSRNNCNAIIETATGKLIMGCDGSFIPQGVTEIADLAFYGCSGMTALDIPSSVTEIGARAFFYCKGLREVVISGAVTEIGERSFCGCDSLETLTIGNSLKRIGYGAFLHDDHIKTVTIGSAVESIGEWAFKGLDAVTSITSHIEDVASVKMGKDVFDEIDMNACTLYVPRGTAAAYKAAPQWKNFKNIVEK